MPEATIENFISGTVDDLEDKSIPEDAASRSLNWLTNGTHIELRRGHAILGNRVTGSGKVTGLRMAPQANGTEVLFRTRQRKIESYDSPNDTWDEIGSNQLPADANGEDVGMEQYHSPAGAQLFISSPNSSIYKVMTANRESITDLSSTNYRGKIKIRQNRTWMWDRINSVGVREETGVHLSFIDARKNTAVTAEALGTGDGTTKTFTGTLAFKAAGAKRTCYEVIVKRGGTAEFIDDRNGAFSTTFGTGTINYTSGAISVTFTTAPANLIAITVDYRWEDSTDDGLADFGFSATRIAGEGDVFRQDDGGRMMRVLTLSNNNKDVHFCMHERKTWTVELTDDDTGAKNFIFREKVGIPFHGAGAETSVGIIYVDDVDETKPRIKVLNVSEGSETNVESKTLSDNVNMEDYRFDDAFIHEWGDYTLVFCRHKDSTINNRCWVYNKKWKSWDLTDYYGRFPETFNGTLVVGDPIQNNVWTLFSGSDDDGAAISNYWEGKLSRLQIEELKKLKRLVIQGKIGSQQDIKVSISIDGGSFVAIGEINGDGAYVDSSSEAVIGSSTLGRSEVGGGGSGITASNYEREFKYNELQLGQFEKIKIKFEALGIGHASVSRINYLDLRIKGGKIPLKYRA